MQRIRNRRFIGEGFYSASIALRKLMKIHHRTDHQGGHVDAIYVSELSEETACHVPGAADVRADAFNAAKSPDSSSGFRRPT